MGPVEASVEMHRASRHSQTLTQTRACLPSLPAGFSVNVRGPRCTTRKTSASERTPELFWLVPEADRTVASSAGMRFFSSNQYVGFSLSRIIGADLDDLSEAEKMRGHAL